MTAGTDAISRARAKAKAVSNPPGAKVSGVTAVTYSTLAKAFAEGSGGKVYVICDRRQNLKGEEYHATVDQWGAWVAYYFRLGIKTAFMERQGHWTVPAMWPHEFDENAPPEDDYEAAKHYRDALRRRIAQESEGRLAPADLGKRVRTYWGDVKRAMPIYEEKKPEPKPLNFTPEQLKESLERCLAHSKRMMP